MNGYHELDQSCFKCRHRKYDMDSDTFGCTNKKAWPELKDGNGIKDVGVSAWCICNLFEGKK